MERFISFVLSKPINRVLKLAAMRLTENKKYEMQSEKRVFIARNIYILDLLQTVLSSQGRHFGIIYSVLTHRTRVYMCAWIEVRIMISARVHFTLWLS